MTFVIDFDVAFGWLNLAASGESKLSLATRTLVRQMRIAYDKGDSAKAWEILQRVKNLGNRMVSKDEQAEVLVECGRLAYLMGSFEEATKFLHDAEVIYEKITLREHERAVVLWMRGCVLWSLQSRHEEAIYDWQESVRLFDHLASPVTRSASRGLEPEWYARQAVIMKEDLERAIEEDLFPISGTSPRSRTGALPVQEAFLRIFTVSEEIPAGGFGPSGVDPNPIGYVDLDKINVDDRPHRIISLRSSREVRVVMGSGYTVVKVKGDSMNLAGIADGDFVLLRVQESAKHFDIIAAEIVDQDTCATLKRFLLNKDRIILRPESDNPIHQERIFTNTGKGFYIRGVALAVFKPL